MEDKVLDPSDKELVQLISALRPRTWQSAFVDSTEAVVTVEPTFLRAGSNRQYKVGKAYRLQEELVKILIRTFRKKKSTGSTVVKYLKRIQEICLRYRGPLCLPCL